MINMSTSGCLPIEAIERLNKEYRQTNPDSNLIISDYARKLWNESNSHADFIDKCNSSAIPFLQSRGLFYASFFLWEKTKQIYRFDSSLYDVLLNHTDDNSIPVPSILQNLPFNTFFIDNNFRYEYIKDNGTEFISFDADGAFVTIDKYSDNEVWVGVIWLLSDMMRYVSGNDIYLISAVIDCDSPKTLSEQLQDWVVNDANSDFDDRLLYMINSACNCISYIASRNADARTFRCELDTKQFKTLGIKHNKKKTYIQKSVLGEKLRSTLRTIKEYQSNPSKKTNTNTTSREGAGAGTPKSPHFRKGHFHSYWIGSHNSTDRQKIIKYVLPTYINASDEDELSATVRIIK